MCSPRDKRLKSIWTIGHWLRVVAYQTDTWSKSQVRSLQSIAIAKIQEDYYHKKRKTKWKQKQKVKLHTHWQMNAKEATPTTLLFLSLSLSLFSSHFSVKWTGVRLQVIRSFLIHEMPVKWSESIDTRTIDQWLILCSTIYTAINCITFDVK